MGFNVAAVLFFLIWGLFYFFKKKDDNGDDESYPVNVWKPPVTKAQPVSKPLMSILKPCSEIMDSDEIEDESEMYNEEDFSKIDNYNSDQKKERRAHFAAEPFLISN